MQGCIVVADLLKQEKRRPEIEFRRLEISAGSKQRYDSVIALYRRVLRHVHGKYPVLMIP
jgi:hypothetical protein